MNEILEEVELIDIWRKINRYKKAYFSAAHGTFKKFNHVLGDRNMANKCKRAEIMNVTFSDQSVIK